MSLNLKYKILFLFFIAAAVIVIANRDMFFETRHIRHLLDAE